MITYKSWIREQCVSRLTQLSPDGRKPKEEERSSELKGQIRRRVLLHCWTIINVYIIMPILYHFILSSDQMSSLKSLTEETTEPQDLHPKRTPNKLYAFFIFYQPSHLQLTSHTLNKLAFRLRDERGSVQGDGKSGDANRSVQMQFYNLQMEGQRGQGLLDLKQIGLQNKSKIVAYCQEDTLIRLIHKAIHQEIDVLNIPIILSYAHPNSDFSIFTGWDSTFIKHFQTSTFAHLEKLSRKWIKSSQQKVDLWQVQINLQQDGRLQKLKGHYFQTISNSSKVQLHFLSHLSLGHHVKLTKQYNLRSKQPQHKIMNKLIYSWQCLKKFCCLKASNLSSSTGVVGINFVDEKGEVFEVLKHLRQYQGSEQSQIEASKVIKADNGILSLLITNIDRFHGNKINPEINCKPGDGRLEIIVFQGNKKCRKIGSVGGDIILKLQGDLPVQFQMGETIYRAWGCKQVKIHQSGRIKACICKDVLQC